MKKTRIVEIRTAEKNNIQCGKPNRDKPQE